MSSLGEHEMYCEDDNCGCGSAPEKRGEICLYDGREVTEEGDDFCTELCARRFSEEHGLPYVEKWESEGEEV